MMKFLDYWSEIIKQAAQSPLGVLSLIVLAIFTLAYAFFIRERPELKLIVFVLALGAASGFGWSVVTANSKPTPRALQAKFEPGWYGFENSRNKDRESELQRNCVGVFRRIPVPIGNTFDQLCASIGRTCKGVCAWQGTPGNCAIGTYAWGDGSQIAYCE